VKHFAHWDSRVNKAHNLLKYWLLEACIFQTTETIVILNVAFRVFHVYIHAYSTGVSEAVLNNNYHCEIRISNSPAVLNTTHMSVAFVYATILSSTVAPIDDTICTYPCEIENNNPLALVLYSNNTFLSILLQIQINIISNSVRCSNEYLLYPTPKWKTLIYPSNLLHWLQT